MAIYEKVIALNKDTHRDHKLKLISDLGIMADMQSIPLLAGEFVEATKEYPIVFVKANNTGNTLQPMALLGLKNGENLFVAADGTWVARYVPAFVRRYPFILADTGNNQFTVCMDQSYAGFNLDDGVPLFEAGGETDFLKNMIQFVTDFHRNSELTAKFTEKLNTLGLLEEKNLKAELNDGREFMVQGFSVVNEEKLLKLDAKDVQNLFTSGELALIYAHLMSLSNLNRLVDLTAGKKAAN